MKAALRAAAAGLALALAVALPLALRDTLVHVVPTSGGAATGPWRGVTDPPTPGQIAFAALAGLAAALILTRRPAPTHRPLLALGLAAAPAVPLLTGHLVPLIAFQGPVLVLVGTAALAVALVRSGTLEALRPRPGALFLAAFAAFALLATRLPGPAGPQGDEPHYLAMAHSLSSDGDLDLGDEFARREYRSFFAGRLEAHTSPASPAGRLYPVHTPGLAVLILPAYALGGYPAARLLLSLVAALTAVLVHRLVRDVTGREGVALATWAALVLTPPLPFYALAIYPETPAALATAVFLGTTRRDPRTLHVMAAAAAAAVLPWLHPKFLPLAVLGLVLTLVRRVSWRARAAAASALVGSVALLLVFFHAFYGRASLSAAYGPGFAGDVSIARIPWGVLALLLDRQFGLLAGGPLWALAAPGALLLWRRRPGDAMRALLLGGATVAVGASFSMWWGGACPPARFVVPALPALAVLLAPALPVRRDASAALLGLGLAIVTLAADAPRALHNRADGESALLRFLAPALDLDPALPSFVLGGGSAILVAASLAGAAALTWARGVRGLLFGGVACVLVAGAVRDTPLIDRRLATRRLLEAYDGDRVLGVSPLELRSLAVPLELRGAPWTLAAGDRRSSGRVDLPPGLYRVDVRGAALDVPPGVKTTRVELAAGPLLLERLYLEGGRDGVAFPLLLPAGVRRMVFTAVGAQARGRIDAVRIVPESLVPRPLRTVFAWPHQAEEDRYRVARDGVAVTAVDRCDPEGAGFRLAGAAAAFLVESPPGRFVEVRLSRPDPEPQDRLEWGPQQLDLRGAADAVLHLPADDGVALGGVRVVPVILRAYGAWITFSGSPGGTSATETSAASPAALPIVTTTSGPPDSAKR
ncbi:MAG: hypothetical protein HY317_00550 [Acidobacteria bacterium]|nr:hypothetical protein [Acidobacteriota bacterium]